MDKRLIDLLNMGTGDYLDPLKPLRAGTLASKVGTLCSAFDKMIEKFPGGFTVDKNFVLSFLNKEKITHYCRQLFKRHGFSISTAGKKPYIRVRKYEGPRHKR